MMPFVTHGKNFFLEKQKGFAIGALGRMKHSFSFLSGVMLKSLNFKLSGLPVIVKNYANKC